MRATEPWRKAVEMPSCVQSMRANRRAHSPHTGLGKLAMKDFRLISEFSEGEFPTIPQPHHHVFDLFKRGENDEI
jgi:hypothetical protein